MTKARFATLWRYLFPLAIALIGGALVSGVVDTGSRPAWIFGLGIALGLVGVLSFFAHLFLLAAGLPDQRKARPRRTIDLLYHPADERPAEPAPRGRIPLPRRRPPQR